MGNCVNEFVRDTEEFEKMKKIRVVIKKLDRGFIKKFQQSFAAENTNDKAEILSESTSGMIINEWIRFMSITWYQLYMDDKLPKNDEHKKKLVSQGKYQEAVKGPFPCPPILGRFWDYFILYHEKYAQFCEECFGTYILRNHDEDKDAFK